MITGPVRWVPGLSLTSSPRKAAPSMTAPIPISTSWPIQTSPSRCPGMWQRTRPASASQLAWRKEGMLPMSHQ